MNTNLRSIAIGMLSLVTILGCGSPCRRADVEVVISACRVEPAFSPSYAVCRTAGLVMPAGFDALRNTVATCDATGSGAFYACLAARCSAAVPAGGAVPFSDVERFAASCTSGGGASPAPAAASSNCASSCEARATACRAACPTIDWDSCAECDATCSAAQAHCEAPCP